MKKLFSFVAFMALSAVMLCSCSDSNSDPAPGPGPDNGEGVDYLVMHYSVGGGDLDDGIIANIMQALDEGCNEKVKMTFQCKLSDSLQALPQFQNFKGTRRFTADDNAHLKQRFLTLTSKYPDIEENEIHKCTEQLKSEQIGDAKYEVTSSEALADFINWSKAKYPKAKRVILVLSDHGGSWSLKDDGRADTRALLFDDNRNSESLSLHDVVNGVNGGGGIDLLYLDACLMSTYENLYGYANCVKYLMASFEVAPGQGGDYRVLTKLLKLSGAGEADMVNTMKKYVDYCNSESWWESSSFCHDMGLYDLSKLSLLTPVLKKAADTLAEKYASDEKIELIDNTVDLPYGDRYAGYIRLAMTSCIVSYTRHILSVDSVPMVLRPYIEADNIKPDRYNNYTTIELLRWVRYGDTENAKIARQYFPEEWENLRLQVATMNYSAYSLQNILAELGAGFEIIGVKDNVFQRLHDELLAAIKSVAYLRCTKRVQLPGIADSDFAYEFCSPGVILVPFNDYYYSDKNKLLPDIPTYQEAQGYYQRTEFDQLVGWSRVLKLLDVFPSALTNTMRDNIGMLDKQDESQQGGDPNGGDE